MGPYNGSVVVVDSTTGRILTMVNQKLALASGFQPCSTIKVSVALAALSELAEADTVAVPAYSPAEVRVIVEVPLLPGDGDEMVKVVAESVMPGLVTVTVALPLDEEYDESPP